MAWGKTKRAYNRARMLALYEQQGGLCHWCQQPCRLPDHPQYRRSTGALSGKAATLDHMYSRLNPQRWYGPPTVGPRHVMACSTCNGKRSKAECLEGKQENKPPVPPRYHWKRNGG